MGRVTIMVVGVLLAIALGTYLGAETLQRLLEAQG